MNEIKAFIHRNRVADVVRALDGAGFHNLSVVDVRGLLRALDALEQEYSLEIGGKVITEVKIELVCAQERVDEAVELIRRHARTGHVDAGWIYVAEISRAVRIE